MRKLTGSQRKAKKKQRALRRIPKGKRKSGFITLYHGTSIKVANSARNAGLTSRLLSPSWDSRGKFNHIHNTLTTDKRYAKTFAPRTFKNKKYMMQSNRRRSKIARPMYTKIVGGKYSVDTGFNTKGVVTIRLPNKVAHKYIAMGYPESRPMKYRWTTTGSNKQGNSYGIRKPIPSRYIK